MFAGVISVIFYIVFFVWAGGNSPTGESKKSWNDIKGDLFSTWISPLIAVLFTFMALAYFIQIPDYSVYIAMALSCLALGFSIAAVSFALVSR